MKTLLFSSLLLIGIFVGCQQIFDITLEDMVLYSNQPYPLLLSTQNKNLNSLQNSTTKFSENSLSREFSIKPLAINEICQEKIPRNEEKEEITGVQWTLLFLLSNFDWFES